MGNFCSSGRNPEAKKSKILGEAQRAVEERRLHEARKKQLLDTYFKAHLEAKQHDDAAEAEPDENKKRAELQRARDCVQAINDFKLETGFKPQKLARDEPVFQDEAWMEYLDVAGIQVSRLVEMSSEADAIYARCRGAAGEHAASAVHARAPPFPARSRDVPNLVFGPCC